MMTVSRPEFIIFNVFIVGMSPLGNQKLVVSRKTCGCSFHTIPLLWDFL